VTRIKANLAVDMELIRRIARRRHLDLALLFGCLFIKITIFLQFGSKFSPQTSSFFYL
jgi:hypothetical protein